MTQDMPMIDVLEMWEELNRLRKEIETLKLLLTFADLRINQMVKERSDETRGHIGNASR